MSEDLGVTPAQEAPASTPTAPDTVQTEQDTPQAEASNQQTETEKLKAAYEKRISRITAARHAEERRAKQFEKELAALKAPKEADTGPKEADYSTVEEYHEARGQWKAEQKFKADQAALSEKQKREAIEKDNQKWVASVQAKEAEFRTKFPDYDEAAEVVNEAVSLADKQHPSFLAFADAMRTSDDTLGVTRYLGQNPDKLEELFSMNPAQIYRAITRIENLLSTPPETQEPEVKQVLAPPKPIVGSGKVARGLDKMSAAELVKWVRK